MTRNAKSSGRRTFLLLSASALALVVWLVGCEDKAMPVSGETLYRRYCASCHGLGGRGDGPLAPSLHRATTDLTILAKSAGGHFDETRILAIIDGKRAIAEHGPREMPVWGAVFDEELKTEFYTQYTGLLQSRALVDYLKSIQAQ